MSDIPKLAHLARSIVLSFEKLVADLSTRNERNASTARSCLGRFKLWSSTSGAHVTRGTRSLGYKLEDFSTLHGHVTNLLQELHDVVTGCHEGIDIPE